ncbi:conserved hypothetical protein [Photobacterium leiognathi lrivu.4.1]|uniref:Uncharacterized protein n=1 Tax=Photobacterium leiognathi lrivu.4.1 TaxID=1248232 RepID=V5F1A7_PHOLE|nr:conserved hypothetical protein [Photobacterium leiognathi lrivu.4.1]
MATDNFDVAYLSKLAPFWDDDELAFALNPEAVLFDTPVAQLPCIAESVKTSTGKSLPMDALFWCLGSQGSAYPLAKTGPFVISARRPFYPNPVIAIS